MIFSHLLNPKLPAASLALAALFMAILPADAAQLRPDWMRGAFQAQAVSICVENGDTANVRTSPDTSGNIIASVQNGVRVTITEEAPKTRRMSWYQLIYSHPDDPTLSFSGYVHGSLIRPSCAVRHNPAVSGTAASVVRGRHVDLVAASRPQPPAPPPPPVVSAAPPVIPAPPVVSAPSAPAAPARTPGDALVEKFSWPTDIRDCPAYPNVQPSNRYAENVVRGWREIETCLKFASGENAGAFADLARSLGGEFVLIPFVGFRWSIDDTPEVECGKTCRDRFYRLSDRLDEELKEYEKRAENVRSQIKTALTHVESPPLPQTTLPEAPESRRAPLTEMQRQILQDLHDWGMAND